MREMKVFKDGNLSAIVSKPHGGKYYRVVFFVFGEVVGQKHVKHYDRAIEKAQEFTKGA
jgi:hypothetical protein